MCFLLYFQAMIEPPAEKLCFVQRFPGETPFFEKV
jgi:hypothetical protein